MSDNAMAIGSILLKNDRILKQSDKAIFPKTRRAFNIDTEQGQGTPKMTPQNNQDFENDPQQNGRGPPHRLGNKQLAPYIYI